MLYVMCSLVWSAIERSVSVPGLTRVFFCKGVIVDNVIENLANYQRALDGQEKSALVRVQMLREIFCF